MEYRKGIAGDMGVHMLDTTRWLLDFGWLACEEGSRRLLSPGPGDGVAL